MSRAAAPAPFLSAGDALAAAAPELAQASVNQLLHAISRAGVELQTNAAVAEHFRRRGNPSALSRDFALAAITRMRGSLDELERVLRANEPIEGEA